MKRSFFATFCILFTACLLFSCDSASNSDDQQNTESDSLHSDSIAELPLSDQYQEELEKAFQAFPVKSFYMLNEHKKYERDCENDLERTMIITRNEDGYVSLSWENGLMRHWESVAAIKRIDEGEYVLTCTSDDSEQVVKVGLRKEGQTGIWVLERENGEMTYLCEQRLFHQAEKIACDHDQFPKWLSQKYTFLTSIEDDMYILEECPTGRLTISFDVSSVYFSGGGDQILCRLDQVRQEGERVLISYSTPEPVEHLSMEIFKPNAQGVTKISVFGTVETYAAENDIHRFKVYDECK